MIQIFEKSVPIGILTVVDYSEKAGIRIGRLPEERKDTEQRYEESPLKLGHRVTEGLVGTHHNSA